MFKLESNERIGGYLSDLIDQKYKQKDKSRRDFCRDYLTEDGKELNDENINNESNRVTQIIKGNKAIQVRDLPIYSKLLGVTCEQILSAGDCSVPVSDHVTNYYIASSKDPKEWEKYINREDKLILNADEYNKTVLDYALEFGNYEFLKYLMDNKYIWFENPKNEGFTSKFFAGTKIEKRDCFKIDNPLLEELLFKVELRLNLIALAVDNDDLDMLNELRARENPQLYWICYHMTSTDYSDFDGGYNERMVRHIASSSEKVLDYFTSSFTIEDDTPHFKETSSRTHTVIFPYISELLDILISGNSAFTKKALKKALKHNKNAYERLCDIIRDVKTNEHAAEIYSHNPEMLIEVTNVSCKEDLAFYENGNFAIFSALKSHYLTDFHAKATAANVAHVTKIPTSPILKQLADELNKSYEMIKNLKENVEDI